MCWLQPATELWQYPHGALAALAIMALIECFAGYHAWRFLLGLNGAIIGFYAGSQLCVALQWPALVPVGAVVGLAGCALFFSLVEPVGMFLFAAATGASFAVVVGSAIDIPLAMIIPVAAVTGLATALACGAMGRTAILTLTAIGGAQQISSVLVAHLWSLEQNGRLFRVVSSREILFFLVLAVAGLTTQFMTTARKTRIAMEKPQASVQN